MLAKFVFECLRKTNRERGLQFYFISAFQKMFTSSIYSILLAIFVALHRCEDSLPTDLAYLMSEAFKIPVEELL